MSVGNFNFRMHSHQHNNCTLSYVGNDNKDYYALVRVSQAGYSYGVTSSESHSRVFRAFYPHRRALGQFGLTIDCISYHEFRLLMNWCRNYTETLLARAMSSQRGSTLMYVQLPDRHFHKSGILTQGITDEDNVGKMVWSPQLTFMTVQDFNDPGTSVVSIKQAALFVAPEDSSGDINAFYPSTTAKYTDSKLYDGQPPPPATGPGTTGGGGKNWRE